MPSLSQRASPTVRANDRPEVGHTPSAKRCTHACLREDCGEGCHVCMLDAIYRAGARPNARRSRDPFGERRATTKRQFEIVTPTLVRQRSRRDASIASTMRTATPSASRTSPGLTRTRIPPDARLHDVPEQPAAFPGPPADRSPDSGRLMRQRWRPRHSRGRNTGIPPLIKHDQEIEAQARSIASQMPGPSPIGHEQDEQRDAAQHPETQSQRRGPRTSDPPARYRLHHEEHESPAIQTAV